MNPSTTLEKDALCSSLAGHGEGAWRQILDSLGSSIHPVDRDATRVWFSFWPLKLSRVLQQSDDLERLIRDLELAGQYRLRDLLDSSVRFLFGSHYWADVKRAVLLHAESSPRFDDLDRQILEVAASLSRVQNTDHSTLVGITCVAFMALQQIGLSNFAARADQLAVPPLRKPSARRVLRSRQKKPRFPFLKTVGQKHKVVFDESDRKCRFKAIDGQDVSMAAGEDQRDYQSIDERRLEGPVPFQCRSGSCGTCWIGILHGRERLSEISRFENKRLKYFGYDFGNPVQETHPPIRLACQAKCHGDLSIVIPPWNGILNMRRADR